LRGGEFREDKIGEVLFFEEGCRCQFVFELVEEALD
jgi:hypothetical protein